MKKASILLLASVLFFAACQKDLVTTTTRTNHLEDVVLENHSKDAEIASKRSPKPKPIHPHDQPTDTTTENPPTNPTNPPTVTSKTVIYLDHDGEIVSGTIWNGGGTITCNSSGLTASQQEQVRLKVAADYAKVSPNFIVTNNKGDFDAAPMNKRVRVILCSNNWYNANAGGIAYINSYTWGDDTPCFVFTGSYGFDVVNIGFAASHEPGHTFGCRHQALWDAACNLVSNYRNGCIMGWGTEWAIGTSSLGCNTIQNDIEVIRTTISY